MRQFLLVIVLVGAAFGGGALVSGPGFRWAQEHLLDYMGLKDGGEIDSLELTPPPGAAVKPRTVVAANEPPRAPEPEPTPAVAPEPDHAPPLLPEPRITEPFKETQAANPAPATTEPAKGGGGPALLGALSSMLSPASAPTPAPAPAEATKPETDAPALLDPGVAPSSIPAAEGSSAATAGDWAEIRRKLAAAGVSRYNIEGDPSGRVVFACLIPLAGKQAVSQRFEAEGDDEIQPAHSVLKRINLWRASQAVAPESR